MENEYKPRLGAAKDKDSKYNPHPSHCCTKHGCKYGYDDCPVWTKEQKQEYPCESCHMEFERYSPKEVIRDYIILTRKVEAYLKENKAIPQEDEVLDVYAVENKMTAIFGYDHYTSEDITFPLDKFMSWLEKNLI